jgi:acylphosphatase
MKHFNITITGKVQGVFFRKYTLEQAIQLGVKGFVRNEPNGNVYCEVEGEGLELQQFIEWCQKGSPMSDVAKVEIVEGVFWGFTHFTIQR